MLDNKRIGKKGELLAEKLLERQGYEILERNFHTRFGEIDIVAIDGDTLIFVEVKTRIGDKFGKPEEAVGRRKIRAITKAGQYSRLIRKDLPEAERIDVVAIELSDEGKVIRRELIKNISI